MGKVPFAPSVFEAATVDIKAAISGLTGGARKLVVVDLDDTLWGGVVGDVGWEGLRIGGHDSVIPVGQRVWIHGKERIPGIIGRKAIHLLEEEERKKKPELKDVFRRWP